MRNKSDSVDQNAPLRQVERSNGTVPYEELIRDDRISGRLYIDESVFEDEIDRIFHTGWVFVGHASEIAEPGAFVTRHLGLQPVLMVRDSEMNVRIFANRCPHRGVTVCPDERGQRRHFRCPYHGWTFDAAGALVGLPHGDAYGEDFEQDQFGLTPVPRVDTYRGFVFGSWAPDGPSLKEHLGQAHEMIDRLCGMSPLGEIETRNGWLKHRVKTNWKVIAENVCDFYHPALTHASSQLPGAFFRDETGAVNRYLGGGHGEMDVRPGQMERAPKALEDYSGPVREYLEMLVDAHGADSALKRYQAGPPHGLVFPNLFIAGQNLFLIQPRGAGDTSHMQTPVYYKGAPEVVNRRQLRRFEGASGPAGMLEVDDSAVWERLQLGLHDEQPQWCLLSRGFDRERQTDGRREGRMLDETAVRGFWRHYLNVMQIGVDS